MATGDTIRALIDEGVVRLYHDYRSGHALDLSGNGNNGTIGATCQWEAFGLRPTGSTDNVLVQSNTTLDITEGTLVGFLPLGARTSTGYQDVIYRRSTFSHFELYLDSAGRLGLFDGSLNTSTISAVGKRYVALNIKDGETGEVYYDGVYREVLPGGALSVVPYPYNLSVGNGNPTSNQLSKTPIGAALVISRRLTATEHAELYSDLINMQWPTKTAGHASHEAVESRTVQLKTDWGYQVSPANEGGSVLEQIGTRGSPFLAGDTSGRWKIETDTISGELCKVLRCVVAGSVYIPTSRLFDASPADAAHGTWSWHIKVGSSSNAPRVCFVSTAATPSSGYDLQVLTDQSVAVSETGTTTHMQSAGAVMPVGSWVGFRVTRSSGGEVTTYLDGSPVVAASGSNPFTDTTISESNCIVFDLDAGDVIALGNVAGNYAATKYLGVVEP